MPCPQKMKKGDEMREKKSNMPLQKKQQKWLV